MNRQQRRSAEKAARHNRAGKMGRQGVDRYIARARRWLIGARFDGIPIQKKENGETIHGLTGQWTFPPTVPGDRRARAAEYAESAPFLWRLEVDSVFLADNGDEYRHTTEVETGQVQMLGELTDTWRDLIRETRDGGNPRHHSHDVVRCWPLVGQA